MDFPTFIRDHMEAVLAEWEAFAKSLGGVTGAMSVAELRDHARRMLLTIVADMETDQSPAAQEAKGKGRGPQTEGSAATSHGLGRHRDGFSLVQLTSEFRALRASVLRLWLPTIDRADAAAMRDMIRFNEAIDQAVAESVSTFADSAVQVRDVFLAMLGHDLRTPLNAIGITSEFLERPEVDLERRVAAAGRIRRSVAAMAAMVNDLLEFSRLQLAGDLPIVRAREDLVAICTRAIDDARAAHPGCAFALEAPSKLSGAFDEHRLAQVFASLLNNAVHHRTRDTVVTMTVASDDDEAVVTVHSFGRKIPDDALESIFDPLVQLGVENGAPAPQRVSVGLGLFVARHSVEAHGGTLTVRSDEDAGTCFSARIVG